MPIQTQAEFDEAMGIAQGLPDDDPDKAPFIAELQGVAQQHPEWGKSAAPGPGGITDDDRRRVMGMVGATAEVAGNEAVNEGREGRVPPPEFPAPEPEPTPSAAPAPQPPVVTEEEAAVLPESWQASEEALEAERAAVEAGGGTFQPSDELPAAHLPGAGVSKMLGGDRIDWFEPTEGMFQREMGYPPRDDAELEQYRNQKWGEALQAAKSEGVPIQRIERNPDRSFTDILLEGVGHVGNIARGFGRGAFLGLPNELVGLAEDRQDMEALESTDAALGGYISGLFNPASISGQTGKVVHEGVQKIGGPIAGAAAPLAGAAASTLMQTGGEGVVEGAGQVLAGQAPTAMLETPDALMAELPPALALGAGLSLATRAPAAYRRWLRGGRNPQDSAPDPMGFWDIDESPLVDDMGALDEAGVQIQGTGRPLDFPEAMQSDIAHSSGKSFTPAERAAERVQPKMDQAVLEMSERIKRQGAPIQQYLRSHHERVPTDDAVLAVKDVIRRRVGDEGADLPQVSVKPFKRILDQLYTKEVLPAAEAMRRAQKAGARAEVVSIEEARKRFGAQEMDDLIPSTTGTDDLSRTVIDNDTVNLDTDDLLASPPRTIDDMGPPTDVDGLATIADGPQTIPDGPQTIAEPDPFAVENTLPSPRDPSMPPATTPSPPPSQPDMRVLLTPRRLRPEQLEEVIDAFDNISGAASGRVNPDPAFSEVSAALRKMRDGYTDPMGQFAGKMRVIETPEGKQQEVFGYSAAMHDLEEQIRKTNRTLEHGGYPSLNRTGGFKVASRTSAEQPREPIIPPGNEKAVRSNLLGFGQGNRKQSNDALSQIAKVSKEITSDPSAMSDLRRIRAYLASDRIRQQASFGKQIHPVMHPDGGSAYGSGGLFQAAKLRGDALARYLEGSGRDMPIGQGLLKVLRGKDPLLGRTGGNIAGMNEWPGIFPELGMGGGILGSRMAMTWGELEPDEKQAIINALGQGADKPPEAGVQQ